jgi:carboxylesterase type B
MIAKLLLICFLLNLFETGLAERVQIQTKFGELRGFLSKPFNGDEKAEIFLNIPYALPPTGVLRFEVSWFLSELKIMVKRSEFKYYTQIFQKPKLYNLTWPEGRDALEFGPGCLPMLNEFDVPVSEECLSLNVFRPQNKVSILKIQKTVENLEIRRVVTSPCLWYSS